MCRAEHKMQYPRTDAGRLRYFWIYRECIYRGGGGINLSPRKEKLLVVQNREERHFGRTHGVCLWDCLSPVPRATCVDEIKEEVLKYLLLCHPIAWLIYHLQNYGSREQPPHERGTAVPYWLRLESGNRAAEIGKSCGMCGHMFSTMGSIQTPETKAGIGVWTSAA